MRYLKDYKLFENSNLNSTLNDVTEACEALGIKNYSIENDGTVNVDGDVSLFFYGSKFPVKFGKVTGNFFCVNNGLTTLEGGPIEVGGGFKCSENKLTSLEGAPKKVRYFICEDNQLTTLKGCPETLSHFFSCRRNNLTSLEGGPKRTPDGSKFNYYCSSNPLGKLDHLPSEYIDYLDCADCGLYTLEGFYNPEDNFIYLSDHWYEKNPIGEVFEIFAEEDEMLFFESLKYNYFMGGNKINESRFVRACDDLGVTAPDHIEGYVWV